MAVRPLACSVPAELPEPELQEQTTTESVLKRKPYQRHSQIRPDKSQRWRPADLQRLRDALPAQPFTFGTMRAIVEGLQLDIARGPSKDVTVRLLGKLKAEGVIATLPHPTKPRHRMYQLTT